MRICVTNRDIIQAAVDKAAGVPIAGCCPIAQSLIRLGFWSPAVGPTQITWLDQNDEIHGTATPPVAAEWIEKYDAHHHVGPFSFELAVTAP